MRIVIVGGGSAGWITAAMLNAGLSAGARRPYHITLVESARVGRIGVGEATVPTIRRTLARIGVSEPDFVRAAEASFKQAIQFKDWSQIGRAYMHPFDRHQAPGRDLFGLRWLQSDRSSPFADIVSPQPTLALQGYAPKQPESQDFAGALPYAYHLDAEKFADFLRDRCVRQGVSHHVDDVLGAELDHEGAIVALKTASGARLPADLYVDCSGFARLLISEALGARFQSFEQWLLCDRAAAARIPHGAAGDPVRIRPYTTSTALSAGWCWDIGLQTRRGVGYVYSSQFLSAEEAERELRGLHHIGDDTPVRHLNFASGRVDRSWVKNCVAIGLSAGFLEPLESTGLFFVEEAAGYLLELLPPFGDFTASAEVFNRKMVDRYAECLDFINLHYCLTQRRDTPFWREVARPERTSPTLAALLERWERKPPSLLDFTDTQQLFSHHNYEYVLYGMGWAPRALAQPEPGARPVRNSAVDAAIASAPGALPRHEDALRSLISRIGGDGGILQGGALRGAV